MKTKTILLILILYPILKACDTETDVNQISGENCKLILGSLQKADSLLVEEKYSESIKLYQNVLECENIDRSDSCHALLQITNALIDSKQLTNALKSIDTFMILCGFPNKFFYFSYKSTAYYYSGNYSNALKFHEMAMDVIDKNTLSAIDYKSLIIKRMELIILMGDTGRACNYAAKELQSDDMILIKGDSIKVKEFCF
tara:strand:- start:443 stop:1039 length:597 start_codon:yes stop_codon:yes gene_type:complete